MSKVFIYAKSGTGKSFSTINLDPAKTGYINCDRKELPFEGWREVYKTVYDKDGVPDLHKSNYVETSKPSSVLKCFEVWNTRPDIENIVLDTITHLMAAEFMLRIMDVGFTKFNKLGKGINDILDFVRDDCTKNVAIYAHNDVDYDAQGVKIDKVKAFGKLVDEKIELPSLFTVVLVTQVKRPPGSSMGEYYFITQSDGTTFAKSPVRIKRNEGKAAIEPVLPYEMPNDISLVFKLLNAFYQGEKPATEEKIAVTYTK